MSGKMYSILFVCAFLLVTPSFTKHFPFYNDYIQDLIDMFNSQDTLYDRFYDIAGQNLRVRFYHDVTQVEELCTVKLVNNTLRFVNMGFNVPLTRIDNGVDTPIIANYTDCLLTMTFAISYPTPDELDIYPTNIVYNNCTTIEGDDMLQALTDGLTKSGPSILGKHFNNAQELRLNILQHRLDKYLYGA